MSDDNENVRANDGKAKPAIPADKGAKEEGPKAEHAEVLYYDYREIVAKGGGVYDAATGDYMTPNRVYDPMLGTWTSEDPTGYVDGNNLFQSFLSNPIASADPNGTKVIIVEVGEPAAQNADTGQRIIDDYKTRVEDGIRQLQAMTPEMFASMMQAKSITLNGNPWPDTQQALIDFLKREDESEFVRIDNKGIEESARQVKDLATTLDRSYDQIVVAAHGIYDMQGEPTRQVKINGQEVDQQPTLDALRHSMASSGGHKLVVSCFDNPWGEEETYSPTNPWKPRGGAGVAYRLDPRPANFGTNYFSIYLLRLGRFVTGFPDPKGRPRSQYVAIPDNVTPDSKGLATPTTRPTTRGS